MTNTARGRALEYLETLKANLIVDEEAGSVEALLAPVMALQVSAEAFREIGLVSPAEAKQWVDFALGAFERHRVKKLPLFRRRRP